MQWPVISDAGFRLAKGAIRNTTFNNKLLDRDIAKQKAAAATKAVELAQRASRQQRAAMPCSTSCLPSSLAVHGHAEAASACSHPAQQSSVQLPRRDSSCQPQVAQTQQQARKSALTPPAASADSQTKNHAPIDSTQATQHQPLCESKPASANSHQQHSLHTTQSPAPQQHQLSLGEKVAARFAAYVPASVHRRAMANPELSLGAKLAAKYAAFLAQPARRAPVATAA